MDTERELRLGAVAARQHSAFSWAQAIAAGFTAKQIRRRSAWGTWVERAFHVYVLAGAPDSWEQRTWVALLEVGSGAVASHASAGALFDVPGFDKGTVEVSVKRGWHHRATAATLHETSWLPPHHVTAIAGVPCTTLARFLFDVAGTEHPNRVARAFDNSLNRLGLSIASVAEVVATTARRGRPGSALMRVLLEKRGPGYVPPESELEALLLAVIEAYDLPLPVKQLWAGGARPVGRVDFAYPEAKLLIECDSRRHHTAMLDWEADIERRAELVAAGWRVLQITWHQLVHEPEKVVARIRQALRTTAV